jgi:XTP/dITP diphosphohydrolase
MTSRIVGTLVIATHNSGKLAEMRELLLPHGVATVSAHDLGLAEPEETGSSFTANATIKAEAAARGTNLCALADDSGLCVDALGGAPGIHSARWAGQGRDFGAAMNKVREALNAAGAVPPFAAHFRCALALASPAHETLVFEGRIFGTLVFPPRGTLGFGYDPIFLPEGFARTFGEMSPEQKHGIPADGSEALSHRARAFQALVRVCFEHSSETRP